jgi:hypothetical protein
MQRSLVVVESNRAVAQRIARVAAAASDLSTVSVLEDAEALEESTESPDIVACGSDVLNAVLARYGSSHTNIIAWTSGEARPLLERALDYPRLSSVIGWPTFESSPRPWELALAVRRLVSPRMPPPRLSDLLGWGATILKWRPQTSADRDRTVADVSTWAERAGATGRLAERLGELSHELLMNAMYDAPIDSEGRARYAHDRRSNIVLDDDEVPTLRLGTDGLHVAVQVVDPFGGLRRHHVIEGILRGMSAKNPNGEILDTSNGGAGLGMIKIYSAGAGLVVDVTRDVSTTLTSFYRLDVNPREFRAAPASLHFFERRATSSDPQELHP